MREQGDVLGAVASFTSRAAEKLRRQQDGARVLTVFLSRSRFDGTPPPYSTSAVLTLPVATSDTLALVQYARQLVQRLWRPGTAYAKAGVVLDGMEPEGQQQLRLFAEPSKLPEHPRLMRCLDQLNARYGADTVQVATCVSQPGAARPWQGKAAFCSPSYTTRFEELLTVQS